MTMRNATSRLGAATLYQSNLMPCDVAGQKVNLFGCDSEAEARKWVIVLKTLVKRSLLDEN